MDDRSAKLFALRDAAQKLADPQSDWGKRARDLLPEQTGLSREGIDYALTHCLEHQTGRGAISSLLRLTSRAAGAHVLLSSNAFVGAFRAIFLGLLQSPKVWVRASRREPAMATLLHQASGECFELTDHLQPLSGHHFWGYGTDETLAQVERSLPSGVHFHAHGAGLGVAVFRQKGDLKTEIAAAVDGLARDTIALDQRGCLSPRLVLIEGDRAYGELIADQLVTALDLWEERVPRGTLSESETADALRHEATMTVLGSSVRAGKGMVVLDPERERLLLPPVGRYLHLALVDDALATLLPLKSRLTTVGLHNPGHLQGKLEAAIGPRRYVALGQMQRPPLDGPVDLRRGWTSKQL